MERKWLTVDGVNHAFTPKFPNRQDPLLSGCALTISGQHAYMLEKVCKTWCSKCRTAPAPEFAWEYANGRKLKLKFDDAEKLELFRIAEGKTTAELVEYFQVKGRTVSSTLTSNGWKSHPLRENEPDGIKVWAPKVPNKTEEKEEENMGFSKGKVKNTNKPKPADEDDDVGMDDLDLGDLGTDEDDDEPAPKPKRGKGKDTEKPATKKGGKGKAKPEEDEDDDDLGNIEIDDIDMDGVEEGGDLDEESLSKGSSNVNFNLILSEKLDEMRASLEQDIAGRFALLTKKLDKIEATLVQLGTVENQLGALQESVEYLRQGFEAGAEEVEEKPAKSAGKTSGAAGKGAGADANKAPKIPAPFSEKDVELAFKLINKQSGPVAFARMATALANSGKFASEEGEDLQKLLTHMGYALGEKVEPGAKDFAAYQKRKK